MEIGDHHPGKILFGRLLSVSENIWDILRFCELWSRTAWRDTYRPTVPPGPGESRVTGNRAATRRYPGQKPDGCRATNGSCGGKIQLLVARETHGGCGVTSPRTFPVCELWILRIFDIFSDQGIMRILSENCDQGKGIVRVGEICSLLREWLPLRGSGIKRKFQNHLNSSKKYFENKLNSPRKSNILKKSQKLSFYTFCPFWLTWLL